MKKILIPIPVCLVLFFSFSTADCQDKITSEKIASYFREISENTRKYKDLWDTDIYGPVLLVEPASRVVYSNYPDSAGVLKKDGEVYSGILPVNINIANTALKWNGLSWAMISLPLPAEKHERLDLLSHELFHRSQPALGFKMNNPANNHLDQKEGRLYLRLELEALKQAMNSLSATEANDRIADAIYFRLKRRTLYPDCGSEENALELNEGLATYTGICMSGRDKQQLKEYFNERIPGFQEYPTFVRSFAYLTIPLYGTLLKEVDKYWNKRVSNSTDLTDFFSRSFELKIPAEPGTAELELYGFERITNEENARADSIMKIITAYKLKFIEQPHLEIRFEKMSISFDPRNILPLEGYGSVYPSMRITDNWGILNVTKGALLGAKWDKVILSEPTKIDENKVFGDGWTLELNKGYLFKKNQSEGNYFLSKE